MFLSKTSTQDKTPFTTMRKRFAKSEAGNAALVTAFSAFMLLGAAGLAIDITRGLAAQTDLADASDALALILAKSENDSEADLRAQADAWLAQHYPGDEAPRLSVVAIEKDGEAVRVQLANNIDTTLGKIFKRDSLDVGASATAVYSQKRMDIALVLDTTESMRGTKMDSLKQAAGDMVTTIDGYDNANVRMSVVPFSNYVNVGLSRRDEPWLEVPADNVQSRGPRCTMRSDVISRSGPYQVPVSRNVDGNITTVMETRYRNVVRGPEYEVCDTGATWTQTWQGCVGSRAVPRDIQPGYRGNRIPGIYQRCGAELQEMSSNLRAVKNTIDALEPQGDTYMPSGLMWGWRTLDDQLPLRSGTRAGTEKVLILMTDGKNSVRKSGVLHDDNGGTNAGRMNAVTREANNKTRSICNGIKGDDIVVYTIAYDVADNRTRKLLEDCATSRGNFFDARNANDLNEAFREIGASLNQLRITA